MTLLQRTPREVYRVFDEDEFLVRGAPEHHSASPPQLGAQRRLRRIAGTTVLVAATGAVGGLLALAGMFSVSGNRRRAGARRFAATASSGALRSASSHVAAAGAPRGLTVSGGSRYAGAGQRSKRVRVSRRPRVDVRSAVKRRVASVSSPRRRALASVIAPRNTPVQAAPLAGHALPIGGRGQPQRWGRPEFGFER
jgi:hypothetical protein